MGILFYFFDETDASKVHVVFVVSHCCFLVNWFRKISIGLYQLTGSKQECQMLIVIETPDSMWSSWFKNIFALDQPHKVHIPCEKFVHTRLQVFVDQNSCLEETEQERDEVKLMTCAVVKPLILSKRFIEVYFDFRNGSFEAWHLTELFDLLGWVSCDFLKPYSEGLISKPHWLLDTISIFN